MFTNPDFTFSCEFNGYLRFMFRNNPKKLLSFKYGAAGQLEDVISTGFLLNVYPGDEFVYTDIPYKPTPEDRLRHFLENFEMMESTHSFVNSLVSHGINTWKARYCQDGNIQVHFTLNYGELITDHDAKGITVMEAKHVFWKKPNSTKSHDAVTSLIRHACTSNRQKTLDEILVTRFPFLNDSNTKKIGNGVYFVNNVAIHFSINGEISVMPQCVDIRTKTNAECLPNSLESLAAATEKYAEEVKLSTNTLRYLSQAFKS